MIDMLAVAASVLKATLGWLVIRIAGVAMFRALSFEISSSPLMPGIFWSMTRQQQVGKSETASSAVPLS